MNFIFLRVMEVWTQWIPCKVKGVTYFACAPLRSYFHDPQKNKIYFLHVSIALCSGGNVSNCMYKLYKYAWGQK